MKKMIHALLQESFPEFARFALQKLNGTVLEDVPYMDLLTSELKDFGDGQTRRLLVNMPQRHGKTMLCSICLPAWILAHDPTAKIMVVTYTAELSEDISRSIRELIQSAWFKETFPTRLAKGHAKVTDFSTTAGGTVRATSFEGSITGFGGDILIIDDPHDIGDAAKPSKGWPAPSRNFIHIWCAGLEIARRVASWLLASACMKMISPPTCCRKAVGIMSSCRSSLPRTAPIKRSMAFGADAKVNCYGRTQTM